MRASNYSSRHDGNKPMPFAAFHSNYSFLPLIKVQKATEEKSKPLSQTCPVLPSASRANANDYMQSRLANLKLKTVIKKPKLHSQFENSECLEWADSVYESSSIERFRNIRGLMNLGNTCFMNSIIQCLNCCPIIVAYFRRKKNILHDINSFSKTKGTIALAFHDIAVSLSSTARMHEIAVNPSNLKNVLCRFAPQFFGYRQHDAQEFLRFLLEGVHDEINRLNVIPKYEMLDEIESETVGQQASRYWSYHLERNDSFLSDLFCGQLHSIVTCKRCGFTSHSFDPFWDLSISIPKLISKYSYSSYLSTVNCTLNDCFSEFTAVDTLTGDSRYYCKQCKKRRTSYKNLTIYKLPEVLVIHLKRFAGLRQKINTTVEYPLKQLSLIDFCDPTNMECKNTTYELFAVTNHMGSLGGGHYTCYGKLMDDDWYHFNDSKTSSISSRVISSSPSAYILFYHKTRV